MEKKRVAFESLGCKLNYAETVQIEKEFRQRGFEIVDPSVSADVFVINTCTVTQSADSDCRQIVRRALRSSPDAFVVGTGCYAQGKPEEVANIDGVDLVLGAKEKFHIFDFVDGFSKSHHNGDGPEANYHGRVFVSPVEDLVDFGAADSAIDGALRGAESSASSETLRADRNSGLQTRTRAFMKIQDGCDYNCSYCTIPRVRGKSRSPSISFIVDEARQIAAAGFKEVVLSGVNVGDFGSRDGHSLLELLNALEQVDGIARYRISSIEPNLLSREIVKFVASSSKFCKHFHVPLQSGADEVLKKMRRRYNTGQYKDIVGYIRELMPEAGIGADVIVGFPGETNEIFEKSMNLIENLPLSYLHVFSYSEREVTASGGFGGNFDPRVKRMRCELLRMISTKKRYEFNRKFVGKITKVLAEEEVKNGKIYGFTSNYIRVEMDANPMHVNEIPDVLITGVSDNTALGQVIL